MKFKQISGLYNDLSVKNTAGASLSIHSRGDGKAGKKILKDASL